MPSADGYTVDGLTACGDTEQPVTDATTTTTTALSNGTANDTEYAKFRKGLNNTYVKLVKEKELTIAYIGGSITAGASATTPKTESYRALTTAWFKKQFPDAKITEINMGIGMAGSKLPAYYVKSELVPKKPDLIFLECAINDYIEKKAHRSIKSRRNMKRLSVNCAPRILLASS